MSTDRAIPLMRSVLTVPVIVPRFVERAPATGADVLVLDLEDSVPPAEKERARGLAREAIAALTPGPSPAGAGEGRGWELYVRVNAPASGLMEDDLAAVVQPGLDGVIVSKSESVEDIERVEARVTRLEQERGIDPGAIAVMPLLETASGIAWAREICRASERVIGAVFGAEDFATDMGVARTREGEEIRYARSHVAVACRAAGIVAIDTPDPDYTDEAHLEREMLAARGLGYRGKLVIHPMQVTIANRVFCPSEMEVAEAKAIVKAFEREGLAQGRAAIALDGKMVDTPIYWRAKRLLEWAEAAGGQNR